MTYDAILEDDGKPVVRLTGENGNVYNIIAVVSTALVKAGQPEKARELRAKFVLLNSYTAILELVQEYVVVE
jgi:hypothetical protein